MSDIEKSFDQTKADINASLAKTYHSRVGLLTNTNYNGYISQFSKTYVLMGKEPEILFFLIFQWITIAAAYLIWSQFFNWVPDEVWIALADSDKNNVLFNLIFLAWSFLIVALTSYPLAICNAAIVAVHNLHTCGQSSTLFKSLALAFRYVDKLWLFSTIDNWITVNAILDRLPGGDKENRRTFADELLYYAWKIATITVVPSLLCGRGFTGAAKDTLQLYQKIPKELISLRLGYSAACWVLGISVYVLSALTICMVASFLLDKPTFFLIILVIGLPVLISAAFVIMFLRPPFLLGIAQLYSENIDIRSHTKLRADETPSRIILDLQNILFVLVLIATVIAAFYAHETGLASWVTSIAQATLTKQS